LVALVEDYIGDRIIKYYTDMADAFLVSTISEVENHNTTGDPINDNWVYESTLSVLDKELNTSMIKDVLSGMVDFPNSNFNSFVWENFAHGKWRVRHADKVFLIYEEGNGK